VRRGPALAVALAIISFAFGAPPAPAAPQLETYYARYDLSGGYSDWTDSGVLLDVRLPSRVAWSGYARETERFDLRDSEAGGSVYAPFASGWAASVDATASSTHRVLPRNSLMAQLEKQFGRGWIVRGGLRRSEYVTGQADLRLVSLERYFGNERVAYTFYSGKVEVGGSAPSHRLDWSHYFGRKAEIGLSGARGREVENVVPQGLLVVEVRSFSLTARYWLSERWRLGLVAEAVDERTLYRRNGIRAELRYGF
jgi:YaiO family outer membrane protein